MGVYKKLFVYVPEKKYLAWISLFFSLISVILQILPFWYLWGFFKALLVERDISSAKYHAMMIVIFMIAYGLIYLVGNWNSHILAFRLENNLRKVASQHLMEASFSYFDLHSSGKIRKIIDDNATKIHTIVAHLIPDMTVAVVLPIGILILTFFVDIKLGILLIICIGIGFVILGSMMGDAKFIERYMNALERMNATGVEYVRGIQVVKIFGSRLDSFKAFFEAIEDYSQDALEYSFSCRIPYNIFQVLFNIIIVIPIPIAILFIYQETDISFILAKIIFFACLSGMVFVCFLRVMYLSMYQTQANTVIKTLEETFIQMKEKALVYGNIEEITDFNIEFMDVCFGYEEERILNHLSFTLEAGKTYALVGSSGGGKSTIAKLISGFYPLISGEIRIGGIALTQYTEQTLMKNIAFVFQNADLFKISIYENVRIANPNANKEEVLRALELARCNDILDKFSTRENTIIGAKGVHLSGGEKQRIAIARAILKNASIIILDEASAATDPENEYELQKAFASLIYGKTVIMIAHRLSSIKNVDEILVVDNGKIIERGNHHTLMQQNGKYKTLQDLYIRACEWRVYGK